MEQQTFNLDEQLQNLQRKKQEAVNNENYEEAIRIRDEISKLQWKEISNHLVKTLTDKVVKSSQRIDVSTTKQQQTTELWNVYQVWSECDEYKDEELFNPDPNTALSPEMEKQRKEGVLFANNRFSNDISTKGVAGYFSQMKQIDIHTIMNRANRDNGAFIAGYLLFHFIILSLISETMPETKYIYKKVIQYNGFGSVLANNRYLHSLRTRYDRAREGKLTEKDRKYLAGHIWASHIDFEEYIAILATNK